MTKLWAVSYISFGTNELTTEFHLGTTWKEALLKHTYLQSDDMKDWMADIPDDQNEAKDDFFNGDSMIEVVEVPVEYLK